MKHLYHILRRLIIICLGMAIIMQSLAARGQVQKQPNILFLFADDQRADALGCSGNSYIQTPNIDKLAEQGVRFSNGYVMGGHHGAICAPSRAMLMSGKSLFHVYDKLDGVKTMPRYFAEYGYETFGTGKWHNGKETFEATFQQGKNVFLGGMSDHFKVPCRDLGNDGKLGDPVIKSYSTDLFADAAISFIEHYAFGKREKPFFCYVAFTAPHDPRSPHPEYIGLYPDGTIPIPGNFKNYHPFAFDDMKVRDENLAVWPRTEQVIQQSLSDYYALISHLDKRIGDIIATLKKEGLFDNTIIIYAADNGLAIGSHGLLGKQNLYEHSMKVPVLISGPGVPKNQVRDALVYLYDLFPTLTQLCKLPIPENIDGKNLTQVIDGSKMEVRNSLYTVYRNTVRAVRNDEWKLIRYPRINITQLYNLKNDPDEMNNLAQIPLYQKKLAELTMLMEKAYSETDDTATMLPACIAPANYNPLDFKQKPDIHQPDYILKRYFNNADQKQ